MKLRTSAIVIFAIFISACTGSGDHVDQRNDLGQGSHMHSQNMDSNMMVHADSSDVSVIESENASAVIGSYLEIKNALVADNDRKAAEAGKTLVGAFDNIDTGPVSPEKLTALKDIIEDARENAEHISESKGNISHQREHFELLSQDIRDLIMITGADRALFEILCPMDENNRGGMWLSESDEIKNPYYGNEMTNNGKVIAVISLK
jgi:hypothetical protein